MCRLFHFPRRQIGNLEVFLFYVELLTYGHQSLIVGLKSPVITCADSGQVSIDPCPVQ